ncbi:HNH endonuclease [Streptomyces sp. C10-9-1]|uniref:HNH endonuclease n=1 Tax=Streptomyces sp. C10-9-1 TaxID=1859285 RepID=UPI003D749DD9
MFGVSASVIGQLWRGATYRHLSRDISSSASGPGTYRGRLQTPERRYAREATFWRQVDITVGAGGCWPFTGPRNKDGYGDYSAGKALIGTRSSHVVAHLLAAGLTEKPPRGTYVRHLCANRVCCNPAHLAIGTQRDNMADRFQRHGNQPGPHPVNDPTPEPEGGWRLATGDPEELELAAWTAEFGQQIDKTGGDQACWPWIGGSKHDFGYGVAYWPDGRHSQAHRIAYLLHHGLTADDLDPETMIRHKCPGGSNPACCNPAHLEPGTQRDNMADRMAEGNYARGDAHFSTKVPDAVIRALREDYWSTPKKARPKLQALAELHGLEDWGTVWRWLHGKSRREAGGPMGEIVTTADMPNALF